MSHVHSRIFDEFRLLDSKNRPVRDVFFSDHALWLEYPGCAIQRTDFPLPPGMRTDGILKPGFYLSIILEGSGEGGPLKGEGRQQYGENELIAMVLREPTRCGSAGCRGAHMRAIGIAFPIVSIRALGLEPDFHRLFHQTDRSLLNMKAKAPPRIQAVASEMLAPTIEGHAGQLLLGAQAMEILIRSLFVLRHQVELDGPIGHRRDRLQVVRESMAANLGHPWSIAELANIAGFSRRIFERQFRAAYGVSAADYLRGLRLEAAKEALVHQKMSIAEAAYYVGYGHPANFATAFKRRFGCAPSQCRDEKLVSRSV
jgi:AraC-like DNA-binding protein